MRHRYAVAFFIACMAPIALLAQGETCGTATPVTPGTILTDGPASGEGASMSDATHADWFSWTATVDAYITIQSCGGAVDTRVHLHQGDCGSLELIASSDDACADGGSLLSNVLVSAGTTCFIEWDDLHSTQGFSWEFYLHACPIIVPTIVPGPGMLSLDWEVLAPGATFVLEYGPPGFEIGTGTVVSGPQGDAQPPVTLLGLNGGQEYQIWISVDCGAGNTAPFTGPWYGIAGEVVGIPNDDCETAIPIACGSSTSGSTQFAQADGPPECGTGISAPGIWYTFTGVAGTVILSTCADHGYDTKLNVYTGVCDDAECVAGNDDGAFGCYPGSEVIINADAEATYYVLVQGYDGAVGDFTLDMVCAPCPPPTDIVVTPADVLAYLSWTPGNPDGTFTVEYGAAGFTPGTGTVITGTIGVDGPPITIPGLALSTAYDAYLTETCPGGEAGYRRGPINFTTLDEPLAENAFCGGAVSLSCGQEASGDTQLGVLADAPECGSAIITMPGLWYTFTGNGDDVTLSTCNNAEFDTKISIWSGTCVDLVCEGGVDDAAGCEGNTSAVTIATTEGTVYFALVHGYEGAGPFTISMSCAPACTPAVTNDDCATAWIIQPQLIGACVPTQGTNMCAYTPASPNPACDPYTALFDVWYAFNTGPSAEHTITVASITAGALTVALYSDCEGQPLGDCYDPQAGPIALTGLDTNTVYYLRVWNEGGEGAGTFTICDEAPVVVSVPEPGTPRMLRAWPIPVEDVLTIDGLPPGSRMLRVCDAQGRTVLAQRVSRNGTQTVDMTSLAPGAYVVRGDGEAPTSVRVVRN